MLYTRDLRFPALLKREKDPLAILSLPDAFNCRLKISISGKTIVARAKCRKYRIVRRLRSADRLCNIVPHSLYDRPRSFRPQM